MPSLAGTASPSQVEIETESFLDLGPNVTVAICRSRIIGLSPRAGRITFVLKAQGNQWEIVALHNTDLK